MRAHVCFLIAALFILSCEEGAIYLSESKEVKKGKYWFEELYVSAGSNLDVDFLVKSGGAVDILVMNYNGFTEFRDRIGIDSVAGDTWDLPLETYAVCSFPADSGVKIVCYFDFPWDTLPTPIDIYLMDSANFELYKNGQQFEYYVGHDSTMGWPLTYEVVVSESLYLVGDNTSIHGSIPVGKAYYDVLIGKYVPVPFAYLEEGSALNVKGAAYTFSVVDTDTCYVVVNNAGYIEGGSAPIGPVFFRIEICDN